MASLVKQLDALLPEHADQKLAAFVNFIGSDSDALQAEASRFGGQHKIEHVALVVPVEHENGPEAFQIAPDAATTVVIYHNQKVTAAHALAAGKLTKAKIREILDETKEMLK